MLCPTDPLPPQGAEIHKKTSNGMTAQNMAMRNRHMVIVSMLDNARFRQTFGGGILLYTEHCYM